MCYYHGMNILKNSLITLFAVGLAAFFVYGSFVFGMPKDQNRETEWNHQVQKSVVNISTDSKWLQSIKYSPYDSGSTASGILSLDLGRLSTAFVMNNPALNITFSGTHDIMLQGFQGIVSLYDPFVSYAIHPIDASYSVNQITNGSYYLSAEPDGTVSIYSIDVVAELAFYDSGEQMTNMILFPGMYIRFDPSANRDLKWADLFRIMLVLGDEQSDKRTGLEFVNPRVDGGKEEDMFFMYQLPTPTRPLFQMLHLLFRDRIRQVENLKSYASNRGYVTEDINTLIYNPSKKNHYLLDDLRSVLSRAVQSQMETVDYRSKIDKIHIASSELVEGNSVQKMLEEFLTDARFAIYGNVNNTKFDAIYTETANILGIVPGTGKGKFFQYLSDIYSRNIVLQRKDPTFSGIDTYTPTADGLKETLDNSNIESKDYFDIALYTYQLLQKTQDKQMFTYESVTSRATYELIDTLFGATAKYIDWLTSPELQKAAYQTLVIQFYAPIAATLNRSLYGTYGSYSDGKIYIDRQYLDGDFVKFDVKMLDNLASTYTTMLAAYEQVAPLYNAGEQTYTLIALRDSIIRIWGFLEMVREGQYREYQLTPYAGIDIGGIPTPSIGIDGKLEIYGAAPIVPVESWSLTPILSETIVTPITSEAL